MPARSRDAFLSDAEAESLRLRLLEVIPRLRRHQLLDLADTLHECCAGAPLVVGRSARPQGLTPSPCLSPREAPASPVRPES